MSSSIDENKRLIERFQDFSNALSRLAESLNMKLESSIIIDGVIQRFEFTYELAWKVMKAYLEREGIFEPKTPREVFRESYRIGLITVSKNTEGYPFRFPARGNFEAGSGIDLACLS